MENALVFLMPSVETQGGKGKARQPKEMRKTAPETGPGKPQAPSPTSAAGALPRVCSWPG